MSCKRNGQLAWLASQAYLEYPSESGSSPWDGRMVGEALHGRNRVSLAKKMQISSVAQTVYDTRSARRGAVACISRSRQSNDIWKKC